VQDDPVRSLIVEDDDGVADAVEAALGAHGHVPIRAPRAADVWPHLRTVDAVLLDLGLPDGDGLDVLRRIRALATVPVLILTARNSERDVVRGLRLGADDFVVKPVRLRELLARLDAIARRSQVGRRETAEQPDVVEIDDLCIDLGARRATVAGAEVSLTAKEFDILAVLARRKGVAVSRQQLLDEVWGDAYLAVSRSLDVHLAALRAKIGRPGLLSTIRGFGFRLGD
jgi:DNA-binding response OmpR family regulator